MPKPRKRKQSTAAWRDADHDARRRMIVDVAMQLLGARGVEHVTMRVVAQQLGVGAMTLYTYIKGQDELRREMALRGFEMLRSGCDEASTLHTADDWRGGSVSYLRFAMEHPNLYELMFSLPTAKGGADEDILMGGFQHLFEKVRDRLEARGIKGKQLQRETIESAGRFWIALHGLASLAIAGRLSVLGGDVERLLDDLLKHVAPD